MFKKYKIKLKLTLHMTSLANARAIYFKKDKIHYDHNYEEKKRFINNQQAKRDIFNLESKTSTYIQ